jgi:hypothetical protein
MAKMSKKMPLNVFAKKIGIDKKEQQWIMDNDKDDHYYNNSAFSKDWLSLSYPVYDGDYYFAFINKSKRVSAQQNATMNRELRRLAGSKFDAEKVYRELYKYGEMHAKNSGLGDTMTREEMWKAVLDIRKKNPVKEDIDFEKDVELLESLLLNEVQDKEIMAMRKVSKDMQKVLKDYQKIATMGDKELKNTKHNYEYKQVLQARDTILSMIGKLQTRQTIEKSMKKESLMDVYKQMHEESLMEAEIVYRVRDMQRPEETKMKQASRMGLKVSMKKQGKDTIVTLSGTKKNLRDFDSILFST